MKKLNFILLSLIFVVDSANADNISSSELTGFIQATNSVDYLAKVKVIKVKVISQDDDLEKQVYFAEVLATYKGELNQNISYEMHVEPGEDVIFNSTPVYIALCKNSHGAYYWPGTGSEFRLSKEIDSWLADNSKTISQSDSAAGWCK